MKVVRLNAAQRKRKAAALIREAIRLADEYPDLDGFALVVWKKHGDKRNAVTTDCAVEGGSVYRELLPDFVASAIENRFNP